MVLWGRASYAGGVDRNDELRKDLWSGTTKMISQFGRFRSAALRCERAPSTHTARLNATRSGSRSEVALRGEPLARETASETDVERLCLGPMNASSALLVFATVAAIYQLGRHSDTHSDARWALWIRRVYQSLKDLHVEGHVSRAKSRAQRSADDPRLSSLPSAIAYTDDAGELCSVSVRCSPFATSVLRSEPLTSPKLPAPPPLFADALQTGSPQC